MKNKQQQQTNQVFTGTARDVINDGRAVVPHPSGMVVFVPGLWTGETASVRITGKQGRAGTGEIIEITSASEFRVQPPCPHHGFASRNSKAVPCGGCPWQFITYEAQLGQKQLWVDTQFSYLDASAAVKPIWAAPAALGYRNRAQLKSDGRRLGFVAEGSRQIAEVEDCIVLSDDNRTTLQSLRAQLPNSEWQPGKAKQWVTLDFDDQISAAQVEPGQRLPFRQANDAMNEKMKQWLTDKLAVHTNHKVLELFCGDGNFTDVISGSGAAEIIAVEGFANAVAALSARSLHAVTALHDNLFSEGVFDRLYQRYKKFDVLVLDPPREGLKIFDGLVSAKRKFKAVYYISCDLATLARDIKRFQEFGYKVAEVQPLDQFPQTPHVECLVELMP